MKQTWLIGNNWQLSLQKKEPETFIVSQEVRQKQTGD